MSAFFALLGGILSVILICFGIAALILAVCVVLVLLVKLPTKNGRAWLKERSKRNV